MDVGYVIGVVDIWKRNSYALESGTTEKNFDFCNVRGNLASFEPLVTVLKKE